MATTIKKNFLVGVEADFGANKIKTNGKRNKATFQADGSQNITMNQSMKTDWMATFRPRIGVATKKSDSLRNGGNGGYKYYLHRKLSTY